jgi:hypothetical protein
LLKKKTLIDRLLSAVGFPKGFPFPNEMIHGTHCRVAGGKFRIVQQRLCEVASTRGSPLRKGLEVGTHHENRNSILEIKSQELRAAGLLLANTQRVTAPCVIMARRQIAS